MLYLAPVFSGFAALIWQILWVRELGLVFGGTTQAVAITTGVFLLGTGIGARWAADCRRDAARGYALCELVVAVWGVVSWVLFVRAAEAGIGGLSVGADGWWSPSLIGRVGQAGVSLLLLGVPTFAMGASLPLLAPLLGRAGQVGRGPPGGGGADGEPGRGGSLGLLAAANTLGAAAGAFSADLLLIPTFGLTATGWFAALAGAVAAGIVWWFRPGAADAAVVPPAQHSSQDRHTGVAPFTPLLAGFAAMGLEVVWFRFLGSALGPYRAVFSLLLAVLLVAWAVGAAVGSRVRIAPGRLFTIAQAAVAVLALTGLYLHDNETLLLRQLSAVGRADLHLVNLLTVATVVGPAALAMGVAFAALAGLGVEPRATAGRLWFATTLGNAAGAISTGLVLLPLLGMTRGAALLAGIAAVAAVGVGGRKLPMFGLVPVIGALVALAFAMLPADTLVWSSFPAGRPQQEGVLVVDEGLDETVVVTGDPEGPARLWTNGHPMSATTPRGQRYMRLLAHVPLLGNPDAKDVLVICYGVGNTLHAASLHPVERLTLADVSRGVLDQSSWFEHANHGVLRDPRLRLVVDDGRHVLHTYASASLDVITLEPPPMAHAGVAALYTREFYTLASDRLREGGWLTQWLPAYQVPEDAVRALIGAFVDVFPDGVLLVGAGRELILVGVKGGPPVLRGVAERLLERPGVAADLSAVDVGGPDDLAATFAADGARLRTIAAGYTLTDDAPSTEWSQISHVTNTRLPSGLLDPAGWERFVPEAGLEDTRVEASRAAWTDEAFVRFSNVPG